MRHSETHSNAKSSVVDSILTALRPVAVGAALLLGNEQRLNAQVVSDGPVATPERPKETKKSPRHNALEAHRPTRELNAEELCQLSKSAKAGSAEAQYELARVCEYWSAVPTERGPKHEQAEALYRQAAAAGHTKAQAALADFLLKTKISSISDPSQRTPALIKEVFALLENASEKGEFSASNRLASLYLTARICGRDAGKAAELLERATLQGCPFSPFDYLQLHLDGESGFEPDLERCEKILRDASAKGFLAAKSALGQFYTLKNRFAEAQPFLEAALTEDDPEVAADLGMVLILRKDRQQDIPRGKKLLLSAAEKVNAMRMFVIGILLIDKEGCNDVPTGARIIKLSADRGFAPAQYLLGGLITTGATPAGSDSPAALLSAAAATGHLPSLHALGLLKLNVPGLAARGNEEGLQILKQGSQKGYLPCDVSLGLAYLQEAKYAEAELYLRRAVEGGVEGAKPHLALVLAAKEAIRGRQPNTLPPVNKLAEESAKGGSAIGAYAYALSRGAGVRTLGEQEAHERRYLEIAASRGYSPAFFDLGQISLAASRLKQSSSARHENQVAAVKWLTLSSKSDTNAAQAINLLKQVGATTAARAQGMQQANAFRAKTVDENLDLSACESKAEDEFSENLARLRKYPWRMTNEHLASACQYADAESLHLNGLYHYSGLSGEKDLAGGLKLLTAAAELGYPEAQGRLAWLYSKVRGGVPPNVELAQKWGQKAAANGDRVGQEAYGFTLTWYKSESPKAVEEGIKWLEKAVAQGSKTAAYSLALVLDQQANSADKRTQRLELLRFAAGKGHMVAQETLAEALITGDGKSIEITKEARQMLSYSTEGGSGNAKTLLALIDRIEKDYSSAFAALSALESQGYSSAHFALGVMYENLETEEKDPPLARLKALEHYHAAANLGEREAMTRIAAICEQGLAGAGDSELAIHFHRLAADRGSLESNYRLAFLLMQPEARESALTEAHARLNIAASKGNEEAKQKLVELERKLSQAQRVDSAKLVQEKMPRFTFSSGQPPLFYRLLAAGTTGGK